MTAVTTNPRTTRAYTAGYVARAVGNGVLACGYRVSSREETYWICGWVDCDADFNRQSTAVEITGK